LLLSRYRLGKKFRRSFSVRTPSEASASSLLVLKSGNFEIDNWYNVIYQLINNKAELEKKNLFSMLYQGIGKYLGNNI
jgi:hypothetical protein